MKSLWIVGIEKICFRKSDCLLILLSSDDDDREAEGSQPQRRVNWSPQLVNTSGSDRPFSSTLGIRIVELIRDGSTMYP